jgi:hypothetical protein
MGIMVAMGTGRLMKKQMTYVAVIREIKIIRKRKSLSIGASTILKERN